MSWSELKMRRHNQPHPNEDVTEVTVTVPTAYVGYFVDKCPWTTSHDHVERGYDIRDERDTWTPILTLDFDGVLNQFTSYSGVRDIPDKPVAGAIKRLYEYVERFRVYVLSYRSHDPSGILAMKQWLDKYDREYRETLNDSELPDYRLLDKVHFPPYDKPPSHVSIDDRGMTFNGDWNDECYDVESLESFVPWNRT